MSTLDYKAAGVDYDVLDTFKRACQRAAGTTVKNLAAQKLTRLEFLVPTKILKRGDNRITISVDRKGPFPPSKSVKVEKVELHLK